MYNKNNAFGGFAMKCPNCGYWNRDTFPRCYKCGQPLPQKMDYEKDVKPEWASKITGGNDRRIAVDEDGNPINVTDERDALANEMENLSLRKSQGETYQRRLREVATKRGFAPSSMPVENLDRTSTGKNIFDKIPQGGHSAAQPYDGFGYENEEKRAPAPGEAIPVKRVYQTDSVDTPQVYDGYVRESPQDSKQYRDMETDSRRFAQNSSQYSQYNQKVHGWFFHRFLRVLLIILIAAIVALGGYVVYSNFFARNADGDRVVEILEGEMDGEPSHIIRIPVDQGAQVYIREMQKSYIEAGGYIRIEIPDYTWYEELDKVDFDTMDITITPFLKKGAGEQIAMNKINYTISIPPTNIEMVTPGVSLLEVSVAMYAITANMDENTKVWVNGVECSDMLNQTTGLFTYNATIQPIGDNVFNIIARAPHGRETATTVTIYRAVQEIPLDLSVQLSTVSNFEQMTISGTTLPGATVTVESPFMSLDTSNTPLDGTFSFKAVFSKYGNNDIVIRATYPDRKDSVLTYTVYYVAGIDKYSKSAWPLTTNAEYKDLMSNIAVRAKRSTVYVLKGTVTQLISKSPQMALMDVGTEDNPIIVMIENETKTNWEIGTYYRLYADVKGMYGEYPMLCVRYTYKN